MSLRNSFFGAVIMRISYGLDVADHNDKHVSLAARGVDIFIKIMIPGRYLVEAIPALRYVPAWFPGAQFRRDANAWKEEVDALLNAPFNATVDQMVRLACVSAHISDLHTFVQRKDPVSAPSSFLSRMLEKADRLPEPVASQRREICKNVAAISYVSTSLPFSPQCFWPF